MGARTASKNPKKIAPENMLTYVERRLEEWAHWFARGKEYGLGYPPCSTEYRLMKEGFVKNPLSGLRPLPVNDQAEEMEKFILEMQAQNAAMALALKQYYFNRYSLRKQAMEAGVSHMQLKALVDMGRQWVAGRMSGIR